jgi:hypothetical protein
MHTHNVLLRHDTFLTAHDDTGAPVPETRAVPVCWLTGRQMLTSDLRVAFEVDSGEPRREGTQIRGLQILVLDYPVPLPVGTRVGLEVVTPYRASQTELAWGRVARARAAGERFDHLVPIAPVKQAPRVKRPPNNVSLGAPGSARWVNDLGAEFESAYTTEWAGRKVDMLDTGTYDVEVWVKRDGKWVPAWPPVEKAA